MEQINTDELFAGTDESILNLSPGSISQLMLTSPDYMSCPNSAEGHQQVYVSHIMIQAPAHFTQLPSMDALDTEWGFKLDLTGETAGRTSWMFSHKLQKVFVKIHTDLTIYVKYDMVIPNEELFIRAMIVYTSPSDLAEPVKKCPNHREQSGLNNPEHILSCSVPETRYVGSETGKLFKDRLSLVVPLSAVVQNEPLKFQFSCQNSCSGMNRKMTSIIFTLENNNGEIYGRQPLCFKVCSCPKRDKEKDEESSVKALPKKRKSEYVAPSTSKKVAMTVALPVAIVKQESGSTLSANSDVLPTPSDLQSANSGLPAIKKDPNCVVINLTMPTPELKQQVLNYAYMAVAAELGKTGDAATFQPYLNDIQSKLGK